MSGAETSIAYFRDKESIIIRKSYRMFTFKSRNLRFG